jgi:hypothetical protein
MLVWEDVFGNCLPIEAATASATKPLSMGRHDTMIDRLEKAFTDLTTADAPRVESWRDLSDVNNFLLTLIELEWATDEGGHINETRTAMVQAFEAYQRRGKLRLTGPSIVALRESLDQFIELTKQISARSYWHAVKHTRTRVLRASRGAVRKDDVVIKL